MKTLYASCWVGEFGWELFCWQGYLRKLSKQYEKTIVACKEGHEILYKDFAQTLPQKISCEDCNMWMCKGYKEPSFEAIFNQNLSKNDRWISSRDFPVLRYDHTHTHYNKKVFAKFFEQEFIQYGTKSQKQYDVIIHARNKNNRVNNNVSSDYRNWPLSNWNQLLPHLEGKSVACIGTKDSAMYVTGDDLRGISLEYLCNVLANSSVAVGPSSGPMHLAALCNCPHVLWFGEPYDASNKVRYKKDWNPFNTKVEIIHQDTWNINMEDLVFKLNNLDS